MSAYLTPFAKILQRAVERTPHAIGGSFAAGDGEMVDSYCTIDAHEWAVLTAHYGVVMAQLSAAFGTLHFGGPEYFIAQHAKLEVVVHAVDAGYFALIACRHAVPMTTAVEHLRDAAIELRREMQ